MSHAWKLRLGVVASWAILVGFALLGLVGRAVQRLLGLLVVP